MRAWLVLLLGIMAVKALVLDSYLVEKAYSQTVQYYLNSQQSCGGFFDCTTACWRADIFIAFYLYPRYPLVFESAKNFDEYVYNNYCSLWTALDPNNDIYVWGPLMNALALLSANVSNSITTIVENVIHNNFNEYGLKTALPSYYQAYFGAIPYDLLSTLFALDIAQKSELVDGNLNFANLNSTLNPEFWQYVLRYVRGEITASRATPSIRALVALMAFGMKWFRGALCRALNTTFFEQVYNGYLNLNPVEYGSGATELLADEALMCSAFGYLDPNYAETVASWLVQSYAIDNGGSWPSTWYAISLYSNLLGQTPQSFLLVATDPWPGLPSITQGKEVITMTLINNSVRYVTKYKFVTMYSSTESASTVSVVGLPSAPLLSMASALFKKKFKSKCSQ